MARGGGAVPADRPVAAADYEGAAAFVSGRSARLADVPGHRRLGEARAGPPDLQIAEGVRGFVLPHGRGEGPVHPVGPPRRSWPGGVRRGGVPVRERYRRVLRWAGDGARGSRKRHLRAPVSDRGEGGCGPNRMPAPCGGDGGGSPGRPAPCGRQAAAAGFARGQEEKTGPFGGGPPPRRRGPGGRRKKP